MIDHYQEVILTLQFLHRCAQGEGPITDPDVTVKHLYNQLVLVQGVRIEDFVPNKRKITRLKRLIHRANAKHYLQRLRQNQVKNPVWTILTFLEEMKKSGYRKLERLGTTWEELKKFLEQKQPVAS